MRVKTELKFCTVVFDVLSIVGNPVFLRNVLYKISHYSTKKIFLQILKFDALAYAKVIET